MRRYLELHASRSAGLAVTARSLIGVSSLPTLMMTAVVGMRMLDVHSEELVCIHQVQRQQLEKAFVTVKGDNQEPSSYLRKPLEKECEAWEHNERHA